MEACACVREHQPSAKAKCEQFERRRNRDRMESIVRGRVEIGSRNARRTACKVGNKMGVSSTNDLWNGGGGLTMGAPYLELRFCLYVFGKVGCDGLIKLVEDAHGEHRVDMTRLDEFVQRICKLHPDPTMPDIRSKIQCRRIRSAFRVRCCSLLVALYEWRVATYEERR